MNPVLTAKLMNSREIMRHIASRLQRLRLDYFNWSRAYLAQQSGVSESTIRRFETVGQISVENLISLAMTLDSVEPFLQLFPMQEVVSIKELEKRERKRQRGRGNKKRS